MRYWSLGKTLLRLALVLIFFLIALDFNISTSTAQEPDLPSLFEFFTTEGSEVHLPSCRALERLAAEEGPERVIVLEYHSDDAYAGPFTEARMAAWGVTLIPALYEHPTGYLDEHLAYQSYRLALPSSGYRQPPFRVRVTQQQLGREVALQARVENVWDKEVANAELIFVLYEDLGRDGYHFVVRAMSDPQALPPLAGGQSIQVNGQLALPEGVNAEDVQAVALVQDAVSGFRLQILGAGTTATAYAFPPPMPEKAAPTAGLAQQPQVMGLRAILTQLRPWLASAAVVTTLLLLLAASVRPHTFRYALRSLRGRADRTTFLLMGVLAASLGVSLLSSVTEAAHVRVGREVAAYWRTTYDLLVRPGGSRSPIETQYNLLEAHYESGLAGGITMAQYEAIKALPEVEVAAPLATLGYFSVSVHLGTRSVPMGAYRIERLLQVDNGLEVLSERTESYFLRYLSPSVVPGRPLPGAEALQAFDSYSFSPIPTQFPLMLRADIPHNVLVMAVDPQAEAALVGLDHFLLDGRYFLPEDKITAEEVSFEGEPAAVNYTVPVLVNTHSYISYTLQYSVSQVSLPLPGVPTLKTLEALRQAGGRRYLEQAPARFLFRRSWDAEEVNALLYSAFAGATEERRAVVPIGSGDMGGHAIGSTGLGGRIAPRPVEYQEYQDQTRPLPPAGLVLEAKPVALFGPEVSFRPLTVVSRKGPTTAFSLYPLGRFDPVQLLEAQALSPNAVPLETYLPPWAVLKYDEEGQPVEPVALKPTFNPGGYVTTPPLILAPLELAELLSGPAPISCIRVRVAGIKEMSEEARAKIEALAQEIVDRTGLEVDVMVGSSPQPVLVHIPSYGEVPPTGYVEELWVKKNVDTAILSDTQWTSFLVLGLTLGVCTLYVAGVSYLSVLGRQAELGLLKAVGWRTSTVVGLILSEQALVGGVAGVVSALLALGLSWLLHMAIPVEAALMMLPLGLGLCLVGGLAPAWRAVAVPPAHVVQVGEVEARGEALGRLSVTGYSFRNLLRRRGRALAAVLTLALATALLAFMGLVTLSARHYLETTLLGRHVAVEVRGYHLAVALLCALVAALTVGDLTLLNARERRREMGLLRAVGWRAGDVVRVFLWEAAWIGLVGGLLGSGLALGGFAALGPAWSGGMLWVVLGGLALPALVSAGAAWYPAWAAAGELPVSSLNELPRQRPAMVERRQATVRLAAGLAAVTLAIGGLVWWRVQVPPPVPPMVAVASPTTAMPTLALTPTATLGPPVEPTAAHPAEAAVESLRMYEMAQGLMEMGEREPGSETAREAADYVAQAFASYGLAVEREEVEIPPLASARYVSLRVGEVEVIPQSTAAHLGTLTTGVLTAPVRLVDPTALPPLEEVEGHVVAVAETGAEDGTLPGLAALLTAYPPEALMAAVSLYPEDAAALQDALATAEGEAALTFEGWYQHEGGRTENIVATLPGTVRPEEEVWLLALRNSEGWEPKADGGSTATALLLELARVFGPQPLSRTLRFVSLGSEQARHFLSSQAFLEAHQGELERVVAVLDLGTVMAGEHLLFGFRQTEESPRWVTTPSLIDLDDPDALVSGLAGLRGEVVGPSPDEVETPGWLLQMGQAVADELDYPLAQVTFRGSELTFMQAGLPAARLAWGMEDGMPDPQAEPQLRVDRLEQSAALAYALVQRLAEKEKAE